MCASKEIALRRGSLKKEDIMKKILIVCAHPDDEILGCGGTVARLVKEGFRPYTLILGEGVTSRDQKRDAIKRKKELADLKQQAIRANKIIGVRQIFFCDFPDNRFDTEPFLDIVKAIEEIKNKIKPDVIFTHHRGDLNIDHKITYNAVLTAFRPLERKDSAIYSFEIPSSTEWNYPYVFNPNYFVGIEESIDKKIAALKCYKGELKSFPSHPRSEAAVENLAKRWGSVSGLSYAEAFEVIRIISNEGQTILL